MKKLLAVVLATAAAAAVAAAITLPAGADDQTAPDAKFVDCLRANGIDIPAGTSGVAIKQWMLAHDAPSVQDAAGRCSPDGGKPGIQPQQLIACLRSHGLQPPAAIDQLKDWMGSQTSAAAKDALKQCGVVIAGTDKGGADVADCLRKNGVAVPAGADGLVLKNWIGDHLDEPAVKDALQKCAPPREAPCAGVAPGQKAPDEVPKPEPTATATPGISVQQ